MRVAREIQLSSAERSELQRLARSATTSVRLSVRARIVLLAEQGLENRQIAQQVGVGRVQVSRWRERYRGWGAMRKLEYIDRVAREVGTAPPRKPAGEIDVTVDEMEQTVEEFYREFDPKLRTYVSRWIRNVPGNVEVDDIMQVTYVDVQCLLPLEILFKKPHYASAEFGRRQKLREGSRERKTHDEERPSREQDERRHVRVGRHPADRHVGPDPFRLLHVRQILQPALDRDAVALVAHQGAQADRGGLRIAPAPVAVLVVQHRAHQLAVKRDVRLA